MSMKTDRKTDHTLPVPPHLLDRACDAICHAAGRMPSDQEGARMTRDLVAAAMEELNAEATRTLALAARASADGKVLVDGLDRHLVLRGFSVPGSANVAAVLIRSGIAGRASVPDRRSRRFLPAVRLNAPWTWTIAGEEDGYGVLPLVAGYNNAGSPPWTSLCPVCRNGRLVPVSGEQLFGISPTDFLSCTSCAAKFVPGTGTFRLVSVGGRRDPEWLRLLNKAYTPEDWQQIARAGSPGTIAGVPGRDPGKPGVMNAGTGRTERESFAIDIGNRTLYFARIPVKVYQKAGDDCFQRRRDTLRTILDLPAFASVRDSAGSKYGPYLDTSVGFFLSELKARGDPVYRRFLHAYGDNAFCSFRAEKSPLLSRRGVYVVAAGPEVLAAGAAIHTFQETVDGLLGQVPPEACFLDGDPERCRINALLCSPRPRSGLYVHPIDDEYEITRVATLISTGIFRTVYEQETP